MYQIEEIRKVGRSARRYALVADGEVALEAEEEVIARFALAKGKILTAETLEEIRQADQTLLAGRAALRLLKFRSRSRQEMRRALRAKQFEPEVIEATLERLVQAKLIDDEELAGHLARQLQERKLGRRMVQQKMLLAGLDRELTERTLAEASPEEELERAQRLAEKYLRTQRGDDRNRLRQRLYQYLARRGFESGVCRQVIEEALPAPD
jgi:regulatory protein